MVRALLLLASAYVALAHNGYAVSLEGVSQVLSLATPPLDMSNAETAKMSNGLSIMVWIRYRDLTVDRTQVEFSLTLNDLEFFWNGLHVRTDRPCVAAETRDHNLSRARIARQRRTGQRVDLWVGSSVDWHHRARRPRLFAVAPLRDDVECDDKSDEGFHGWCQGARNVSFISGRS
jgi:hypothetical protein